MFKRKSMMVLAIVVGSVFLIGIEIGYAWLSVVLGGNGNDDTNKIELTTINLGTIIYDDVDAFNSADMYLGEMGITTFTIKKGSQSGAGTYEIDLQSTIDSVFGTDVEISLYKSIDGSSVSITPGTLVTSGEVAKVDTLVVGSGVEKVYGPTTLYAGSQIPLEIVDFDTNTLADTTYYLVYNYKNNPDVPQNDQMGHNFSGKVSVRLTTGIENPSLGEICLNDRYAAECILQNGIINTSNEMATDEAGNVIYRY